MVKWISGLFDSTDKELGRLRRIVAGANEEILRLLETPREAVGESREETCGLLAASRTNWQEIQAGQMAAVMADVQRLVGEADALRAVIEKGEQTSRDVSVLLADSKQLAAMNAERLQRSPSERREIEEEIEVLVDELGEQLAQIMELKPALRDAILQAVPKARLFPQRPEVAEMLKQVDATAIFLGREIAGYFGRTNETMSALRRAVGLTTLARIGCETSSGISRRAGELYATAERLVRDLAERDIIKH